VDAVTARKLIAVLLASGYFLSGACRFVCAEMMSRGAESVVPAAGELTCHHHHSAPAGPSSKHTTPAPCCMIEAGPPALINVFIAAPTMARGFCVDMVAARTAVALDSRRRIFASDLAPPDSLIHDAAVSPLSPRAPPFSPAIL
jgi:hypothetical protein